MDPIAHTLTGAALAASGLRRATGLATAALIVGANAPDIDVVTLFIGDYWQLALRRGWTHGVLAVAVLPFIVTGLLLLWDRCVRRRTATQPVRAGPLLGVAVLAVATHPTLDWLNNYGIRWLMPFDDRWFYGDALFIVDPWVWLLFGGMACLSYSRHGASLSVWLVFWALSTALIFSTPIPVLSRVLWVAGIVAILAARAFGFNAARRGPEVERATRVVLGIVGVYIAVLLIANLPARAEVRAVLASEGVGPVQRVMVGPVLANPFSGQVVAETPTAYYVGEWNWLARPRFELADERIVRLSHDPVIDAAIATPEARRYLVWARFPYYEVEAGDEGYVVRILDARYPGGGLRGLGGFSVRLDRELRPVR